MRPDEESRPTTEREQRRSGQKVTEDTTTDPTIPDAADYLTQLHRRRAASRRMPVLDCGCGDPWHRSQVNDLQSSRRAWMHLAELDLVDGDGWITGLLAEGVAC